MNYNESHSDLARLLWRACLNNTPWCQSAFKWMRDVRVGDLVVELTSRSDTTRDDRMGRLLRTEGDEDFYDRIWVIDTGHGEMRWHNAQFARVPVTEHERQIMTDFHTAFLHRQTAAEVYRHTAPCAECTRAGLA